MTVNVLMVRWGMVRIHDIVLASLLERKGCCITFALFTPHYVDYHREHDADLRRKVVSRWRTIEFRTSPMQRDLIRVDTLFRKLAPHISPRLLIGLYSDLSLRCAVNINEFHCIIPIEQYSLYWAARAFPSDVSKFYYYSLEVLREGDPGVSSQLNSLIRKERQLLANGVRGLIVQDWFRRDVILPPQIAKEETEVVYLPLPILGTTCRDKGDFFYRKMNIGKNNIILLYFGDYYRERKIEDLLNAFRYVERQDVVLILHGSAKFEVMAAGMSRNVFVSRGFVPESKLKELVSSCDIGIALYDNSWPNTRFSAFSSEKISRYLQCGKPFVAFRNESFEALRDRFRCCELINTVDEFYLAVDKILCCYESYERQASLAFRALFSEEAALSNLEGLCKDVMRRTINDK